MRTEGMSAVVAAEDKKCPYCAELIKGEAIKCKHCGEMLVKAAPMVHALPAPKPGQKASMMGLWLLLAPGAAILILLGYGSFIQATETPAERAQRVAEKAIELCRDGVNDELATRSTRVYTRQACEKMEADFYQKYGRAP